MRIRNRSMQFPYSFSPPPQTPSDLPRHDKQQQDQESPPTVPKETRSEMHPMAHHTKDRSDGSNSNEMINKESCMASFPISKTVKAMEEKDGEEEDARLSAKHKGIVRLQSWNENLSCEDAQTTASISFSSTVEKWKEEERAFPLKKRKGSFGWETLEDIPSSKEKKKKNSNNNNKNNKIKINKRLDKGVHVSSKVERNKKRKLNAGVAMEGSRCSRVNGRGWRCSQQTLVGYSLCEHHLGKGRLRSMASVPKGASFLVIEPTTNVDEDKGRLLSPKISKEASIEEKKEEAEEKLMLLVKNNKKNIRVVKARSISSLLDHAHHATMAQSS